MIVKLCAFVVTAMMAAQLPEIWVYSTFGTGSKTAEIVEQNVDLHAFCAEGRA